MHSRVNPSDTLKIEVLSYTQMNHGSHELQQFASGHTFVDTLTNDSPGKEKMLTECEGIYGPILKTMKFFGLYFGETSLKRMSSPFCLGRRRVSISLLYCCAAMAIIWFNVPMTFITLCLEGTTVLSYFFRLTSSFLLYLITSLSGTMCMFILPLTVAKQSRFEKFIRSLIQFKAEFGTLRSVSRKSLIFAVLVWITSTIGAIISVRLIPLESTGTYKPWNIWYDFTIVYLLSHILGYGAVLLPISLFCTTCVVLEQLFDEFCKRASIKKTLNSLDLKALKEEHRKLCGVVELASNVFSSLLFVYMLLFIPFLCFVFYLALRMPSIVLGCVYLIIISAGKIAILLVFGTRVNEKIHSFQSVLEAANVTDEALAKWLALRFYLKREPIGLSIGGVVVITKSVSLAIAGFIVSYFTVMLSIPG